MAVELSSITRAEGRLQNPQSLGVICVMPRIIDIASALGFYGAAPTGNNVTSIAMILLAIRAIDTRAIGIGACHPCQP